MGIYASFIIIFAFTLSLFYTSRCQKSSRRTQQDADVPTQQNSSVSSQIVVKKLDINKGQSESKNEAADSDNEVNDENIKARQSKTDSSDRQKININGIKTPSAKADNPVSSPVTSQPSLSSDKQKLAIYFSTESTGLTDKALGKLKTIYLFLLRYPDEELIIEGYGDSNIPNRHNKNLSKLRANIVAGYFVKRGISNSRIKTFWLGSENPAGINASKAEKNNFNQVKLQFKLPTRYDLH
jgi:outer membrane protein OmpA-like peptidoglycan-associated protein